MTFINITSYLSDDIKSLFSILDAEQKFRENTESSIFINQSYSIEWKALSYVAKEVIYTFNTQFWHYDYAKGIAPVLLQIKRCSQREIKNSIDISYWNEMGMNMNLLSSHVCSSQSDIGHNLLSLLLLTATIERLFGKLYLIKGKNVPFLLRDIISSEELKEILGEDVIAFFTFLVGSVHGLNLRNLAWHGFICQEVKEVHLMLILVGVLSLKQKISPFTISLQPYHQLECPYYFCELWRDTEFNLPTCLDIIQHSSFVSHGMFSAWKTALELVDQRCSLSVTLLLPLLENALRNVFAFVNNCTERVLSATKSEYYTTLDEIFCQIYVPANKPSSDRTVNLVPQFLGRQLMEAFADLIHLPSGLRLRDRISHGEIKFTDIPFGVTQHLVNLSMLSITIDKWRFMECLISRDIRYIHDDLTNSILLEQVSSIKKRLEELPSSDGSTSNLISDLASRFMTYESIYHPIAILKMDLICALKLLHEWQSWKGICHGSRINTFVDNEFSIANGRNKLIGLYSVHHLRIDELITCLTASPETKFSVLFMQKNSLQIVKILSKIVCSVTNFLRNIEISLVVRTEQYTNRELRSRQRNSYEKQIANIPKIVYNISIVLQLIGQLMQNVHHFGDLTDVGFILVKRNLQKVLKTYENSERFSKIDVNKWEECVEITEQLNSFIGIQFYPETADKFV